MKATETWNKYHIAAYIREHFEDYRTLFLSEKERLSALPETEIREKAALLRSRGLYKPYYVGKRNLERRINWIAAATSLLRMTKGLVLNDGTQVIYKDVKSVSEAVFVSLQMVLSSIPDQEKTDMKKAFRTDLPPSRTEMWDAAEITEYVMSHIDEYNNAFVNLLYLHETDPDSFGAFVIAIEKTTKGAVTSIMNNTRSALAFASQAAALNTIQDLGNEHRTVGAESAAELKNASDEINKWSIYAVLTELSDAAIKEYVLKAVAEKREKSETENMAETDFAK